MKATDALALYLQKHDATHCYEMIGGVTTHIIDSLWQNGEFNITSVHHEQAAAFAAEGVSRRSAGKQIGIAIATSGPGATNLITGIGSCWFDSVPCLFITGQVNTSELKGSRPIRQQGFQELDIVSLVQPITKYAATVMRAEDLLPKLHAALSAATSNRQGPVLLDIPNNIQRGDIPDEIVQEWINKPIDRSPGAPTNPELIDQFKHLFSLSSRPLFVLGGGSKWSEGLGSLVEQLIAVSLPYVSTLMGQGSVPWSDCYFGMIGSYGHRTANEAVQECDLLIVLGARLDVRQTGANVGTFAKNAKIIQVDIDIGQISNRVRCDLGLNMSVDCFLEETKRLYEGYKAQDTQWLQMLRSHQTKTLIDEYPDWEVSPFRSISDIVSVFKDLVVDFVCDVGNHQMWAAHCLRIGPKQSIHHSGGMGAMGFALPTAIGVSAVSKGKTIVLTGDGSLQVNIQELDTISRLGADILVVVFNNKTLGMVKNFQDLYFNGRNQSTKNGYSSPSFSRVAQSFGIESYTVQNESDLREALNKSSTINTPFLIEILMDYATECRPRLVFGNDINQQHPLVKDV
jgi:acetolactate synthase-1/2/3 large subunit